MCVNLGAGWHLHHLTDRVVELRKDDATYRRVLGRDGYVRLRAEPGMDRQQLLDRAQTLARENDARLAEIVATQILPKHVTRYQQRQAGLAPAFATPEEPEIIGRKRA
jgi:hypothetical protein